ncbi:transcriptional regulator, TetR family [Pseudomonas cuatrocienegasensis]|uniref:Transcriptional regulator, TetR family n=1 Tax=Pseudomonas cuatrocienegasensis TaxID=543360 RepID=A0ABY1B635_9PSED|nr:MULTISPECIES: TetR/AcrR family transcriptional regulator [Pseudomonas]SEQ04202.1 transcriptional regulator, TetR family [Pseudomonas cuatrocienegasensis]
MSTRKPEQSYHHGELRSALVLAATELLVEGGLASISLREVARRAGVSHNAPYRHFADRDSLLAALATQGFIQLEQAMDQQPGGLAELGQCYVRFALAQPGHFALMFSVSLDKRRYPELQQAAAALHARLVAVVQVAAPQRPHQVATLAAWSLVHGLAHLLQEQQLGETLGPGLSAEQLAEQVTQLFARLL